MLRVQRTSAVELVHLSVSAWSVDKWTALADKDRAQHRLTTPWERAPQGRRKCRGVPHRCWDDLLQACLPLLVVSERWQHLAGLHRHCP